MPDRACVFVIFDKNGEVDESVHYYLKHLVKFVSRLVIVTNGFLTEKSISQLKDYTEEIIVRSNEGYDVAAFKEGIIAIGFDELKKYDELIVANDSVFGPIYPFDEMFEKMEQQKDLSFWGITAHRKMKYIKLSNNPTGIMQAHIQSYFTVYNSKLLNDKCFEEYWTELPLMTDRKDVIEKHETYATYFFEQKGHKWDSYVPMVERASNEDMLHSETINSLEVYHCPVIKKRIFTVDPYFEEGFREDVFAYVKAHTQYSTDYLLGYAKKVLNNFDSVKALDWLSIEQEKYDANMCGGKRKFFYNLKKVLKHSLIIWGSWKIARKLYLGLFALISGRKNR